jgi:hypothetical protein
MVADERERLVTLLADRLALRARPPAPWPDPPEVRARLALVLASAGITSRVSKSGEDAELPPDPEAERYRHRTASEELRGRAEVTALRLGHDPAAARLKAADVRKAMDALSPKEKPPAPEPGVHKIRVVLRPARDTELDEDEGLPTLTGDRITSSTASASGEVYRAFVEARGARVDARGGTAAVAAAAAAPDAAPLDAATARAQREAARAAVANVLFKR